MSCLLNALINSLLEELHLYELIYTIGQKKPVIENVYYIK